MPKILLIGDIHQYARHVKNVLARPDVDFAVCTGDMEEYTDYGKRLYFINGNHDEMEMIKRMDEGLETINNLRHIKTGEIIEVEGVKISGLNGNYGPKTYAYTRKQLEKDKKERHFNFEDIKKCGRSGGVDIFLTHECPAALGLLKGNENVGKSVIDELLKKIRPRYSISGHHHRFMAGALNKTRLLSLGMAAYNAVILNSATWEYKQL